MLNANLLGTIYCTQAVLPMMLEAMFETGTRAGWGIDGSACAVFESGRLIRTLGRCTYEVIVTDFGSRTHTVTAHAGPE